MTREEAIKIVQSATVWTDEERDALAMLIPELAESEDEKMCKAALEGIKYLEREMGWDAINGIDILDVKEYLEKQKDIEDRWVEDRGQCFWDGVEEGKMLAEKQKEQKPAEHKAFEEWAEDYWSHNKGNNPYSYNKGDEIQFDHKGFVSFCEAYCYPQNLVLHDTFGYEEGRQTGRNEGVKLVLNNPEKYGLQKEQKPAEWSEEDKETLKDIISGLKAQKLLIFAHENQGKAQMNARIDWLQSLPERFNLQPKQEWSEEDENMLWNIISIVGESKSIQADEMLDWLKSLRPSWKPSEEQMEAVKHAYNSFPNDCHTKSNLKLLYHDLEKLT